MFVDVRPRVDEVNHVLHPDDGIFAKTLLRLYLDNLKSAISPVRVQSEPGHCLAGTCPGISAKDLPRGSSSIIIGSRLEV
jgi:hypothetical protein